MLYIRIDGIKKKLNIILNCFRKIASRDQDVETVAPSSAITMLI